MMRKIILLILFSFSAFLIQAIEIDTSMFEYDKKLIDQKFELLNKLDKLVDSNPEASFEELCLLNSDFTKISTNVSVPYNNLEICEPGNFPSFWFTFSFSLVGTYFIYGAAAGPLTTIIVYFSSDKNKKETNKAIWGCVTGTIIGAGIKYAVISM